MQIEYNDDIKTPFIAKTFKRFSSMNLLSGLMPRFQWKLKISDYLHGDCGGELTYRTQNNLALMFQSRNITTIQFSVQRACTLTSLSDIRLHARRRTKTELKTT